MKKLFAVSSLIGVLGVGLVFAAPGISLSGTNSGPVAGGTTITITGTEVDFTNEIPTGITVGGSAVATSTVVDATTITAVTPAGTTGAKDVVVTTASTTYTAAGAFTYVGDGQSITVTTPAPASAEYGTTFSVAATAPGGTVTVTTSGACSNVGNDVTMTAGTGTCTVRYNQAGDSTHAAADEVVQTTNATPISLTATITASNKTYDGTNTATISNCSLSSGVINSDDVSCVASAATFPDKDVGTSKNVTAAVSLDGTKKDNYTLSSASANTSADITTATLTYTANIAARAYGAADPAFSGNVTGFASGDNQGNSATGTLVFAATVTSTSDVGSYAIDGSGLSASNYTFVQAPGNATALTISKADAVISVSGYTGTYDALAHGATGSATGVLGEDFNSSLSLGGTYTNAPGGIVLWTFTAPNGNYNSTSGNATITINKANPNVTVNSYSVTYDGSSHTSTGSALGVEGEMLAGLDLSGTTHTNAGNYTDSWTFTDSTGNYNTANGTVSNTIAKAPATVTITDTSYVHDGTPKSVTTSTNPSGLTVEVTYNGSATVPSAVGSYTVVATINETNYQGSATDTLTITNTAPTADSQSVSVDEDGSVDITLTGSDTESDPLTYIVVTNPANGVLSGSGANRTYTPSVDFNGSDSFTFKTNDSYDDSTTATVTITVNAVNDTPSFTKGADQTVNEDAGAQTVASWATNISAGPSNENTQAIDFIVINDNNALFSVQPAVSPTGTLTYTPAADANGSSLVSVSLHDDGSGADTSAVETFTITVSPVNDAPVLSAISNPAGDELAAITFTASATDVDTGTTFNYSLSGEPSGATINSSTGEFSWTPTEAQGGNGPYPFDVIVSDGNGGTDSQSITVTANEVNVAPTANVLSVITAEDTSVSDTVSGSDVDDPVQTLTFAVASGPSNGTLTSFDSSTGAFTYEPNSNYNGADLFTFTANDGTVSSSPVTVSITVSSVNDTPIITLLGNSRVVLSQYYGDYTDQMASAVDVEDGNISSSVTADRSLDTSVVGNYTITYSVTDSNGAIATTSRDITIVYQVGGSSGSSGTVGCRDSRATNYDASATYDGIACVYPQTGTVLGVSTTNETVSPQNQTSEAVVITASSNNNGEVLGATMFAFTRNLRLGNKGEDVSELQKILIAEKLLSVNSPTGYFGALTRAALVKWQAKNGLPATGFFGAMSRALLNK